MKNLPDKPSELLRLAVHDLELCERLLKSLYVHMRLTSMLWYNS